MNFINDYACICIGKKAQVSLSRIYVIPSKNYLNILYEYFKNINYNI